LYVSLSTLDRLTILAACWGLRGFPLEPQCECF
jgi:hypothetical protein